MMEDEISVYECLSKFREPLINKITNSLKIPKASKGLDAGCAIGTITKHLSDLVGNQGLVFGLDYSKNFIKYAKNKYQVESMQFKEGDVNALPFDTDTFDWVWSMDVAWPGPKELGFPSEDPVPIIEEFYRVIKPGGSVYLIFWSSQQLLAGFPVLEAILNSTSSPNPAYNRDMDPVNHVFNARHWLEKSGFKNLKVTTFLQDIIPPFNENDINALLFLFEMLWGSAKSEIDEKDWNAFKEITNPSSSDYVLKNKFYYGFYTYTLFTGVK